MTFHLLFYLHLWAKSLETNNFVSKVYIAFSFFFNTAYKIPSGVVDVPFVGYDILPTFYLHVSAKMC